MGPMGQGFATGGWGDFLAINRHVARSLDTEANLVAVDLHDGHDNVVADYDLLTELPAEHQHESDLRSKVRNVPRLTCPRQGAAR